MCARGLSLKPTVFKRLFGAWSVGRGTDGRPWERVGKPGGALPLWLSGMGVGGGGWGLGGVPPCGERMGALTLRKCIPILTRCMVLD